MVIYIMPEQLIINLYQYSAKQQGNETNYYVISCNGLSISFQ